MYRRRGNCWNSGILATVFAGMLAFAWASAAAQSSVPQSISATPGIHIRSFDGKSHRSAEYYDALRNVVLREFKIPYDSSALNIVFIGEEMRESMNVANPDRFGTADWLGAFVPPSLIFIVGDNESDDTFMHEYLHSLEYRGMLFTDVPRMSVHSLIQQDEGLLLGSDSYLEFLKTRHP